MTKINLDKPKYSQEGKPICPFCQSDNNKEIKYGLFRFRSPEEEEEWKEKYWSGGCIVSDTMPMYHCLNCGNEFGLYEKRIE